MTDATNPEGGILIPPDVAASIERWWAAGSPPIQVVYDLTWNPDGTYNQTARHEELRDGEWAPSRF